jgi:hypothetical protein
MTRKHMPAPDHAEGVMVRLSFRILPQHLLLTTTCSYCIATQTPSIPVCSIFDWLDWLDSFAWHETIRQDGIWNGGVRMGRGHLRTTQVWLQKKRKGRNFLVAMFYLHEPRNATRFHVGEEVAMGGSRDFIQKVVATSPHRHPTSSVNPPVKPKAW